MKTFTYSNATNIDEALAALKDGKGAVLAGGTDILNVLKIGALPTPPERLVNIKNIPGLSGIKDNGNGLTIGATTRLSDIAASSLVKDQYPALAQAAGAVSSSTLRQMGTLGGNLCQAVECWYWRRSFLTGTFFNCLRKGGTECYGATGDNRYHAIIGGKGCFAVCPSDTAIALTALDATIVTTERSIAIGDFFKTLNTALKAGEIVKEVTIPKVPAGSKQAFFKFAQRPTIDFAIASAAAMVVTSGGKVTDSRIVLGAVAPTPYRATAAEAALKGNSVTEDTAIAAGTAAVKEATPLPFNGYKIEIAKNMVKRAVLASV